MGRSKSLADACLWEKVEMARLEQSMAGNIRTEEVGLPGDKLCGQHL